MSIYHFIQNICFFFPYVNRVFHTYQMWIMWITLCITQISRFFNLSKMWITFTPFFALSTFSPFIRQPLCNLLNTPLSSTIFAKRKELQFYKLRRTITLSVLFHIGSNAYRCIIIIICNHNSFIGIQCMNNFAISDI